MRDQSQKHFIRGLLAAFLTAALSACGTQLLVVDPQQEPVQPEQKAATKPRAIERQTDDKLIKLKNHDLEMIVTPDFGGRLLAFNLAGRPNIIKTGDALETVPEPEISAFAPNVSYLGHTVWLGPQSQWWTQQSVNGERAKQKAVWPPDAYTAFAPNQVLSKGTSHVVLQGPESPVWCTQNRKKFALSEHTAELNVQVKNVCDKPIAWDIWFNTRVHPQAVVYVPVNNEQDVWLMPFAADGFTLPGLFVQDGLFTPSFSDEVQGSHGAQGKFAIQPSAGWMAAFYGGQVFVIQFPLRNKKDIHPEHGQVELFFLRSDKKPAQDLTELELHSPYKTLQPLDSMVAQQTWTLHAYDGPDNFSSHKAFLKKLGLPGVL